MLGMRPVAAPQQTIRPQALQHQRQGLFRKVQVLLRRPAQPIDTRDLDPQAPALSQLKQAGEGRLLGTESRIGPAEVIDHHLATHRQQWLDQSRQILQWAMQLDMPVQLPQVLEKPLPRRFGEVR